MDPAVAQRQTPNAQRPLPPNIVFILIDDQRWDALGCAGHRFLKTPNIDRLAREGAMFRNAFVTTPLCSPSRASFLTGQYVHANGVRGNGPAYNARSHELETFPKRLQAAGYETAYVGKWHMGNDDSPRPGFDRWVSFRGQGVYNNPVLNVDGQRAPQEGYVTDILSDRAAEFIRRPHGKPFAVYLSHKAVHGPFTPAERHRELYADPPITRSPGAADTLEGKPALTRPVNGQPAFRPGGGSGEALIRNQLRCTVAIDEGVGRVLKALEETRQLDRTLVIYTSDNGYFWGEHGLGDKRLAYEESIRVPLLMRYPPLIRAGSRPEGMALNVDIAPTLLELARAPVPAEMHGRSLLPLFREIAPEFRKAALFEYFAEPGFPRHPTWQAVRTDRWKYIRYPELEGTDEVYDLRTDPHELKNLAGDPGSAGPLRDAKAELERLLKETGA
jgi:N-acetylglucosamine-6-sulfatase